MATVISISARIANDAVNKTVAVEGKFEDSREGLERLLAEVATCITKEPLTISVNQPEPTKAARKK